MIHPVRRRFWLELALAIVSIGLLVVTLLWHDWIEVVFGVEPDGGSGTSELAILLAWLAMALTSSCGAALEWRRAGRHV
jgi:hypothetical protein